MSTKGHVKGKGSKKTARQKTSIMSTVARRASARYDGGIEVVKNPNPTFGPFRVPISPQIFQSSAGTVLSQSSTVTAAMIDTFATRIGTVFREYVIVGYDFTVTAVGGNPGTAAIWVDELVATAPTSADASRADHVLISLTVGDQTSTARLKATISEINDAGWSDTNSTVPAPAFVKAYSDGPLYGLTAASSRIIQLDGHLLMVFRGWK